MRPDTKIAVFCDVTPFSLVDYYTRFGASRFLLNVGNDVPDYKPSEQ